MRKCHVPEGCKCAQDELDDAMSDDVPFLWSRLVDLELMVQEPEDVLQKEEFRPVELRIRQHVAHQGVPASANGGCVRSRTATRHSSPT